VAGAAADGALVALAAVDGVPDGSCANETAGAIA